MASPGPLPGAETAALSGGNQPLSALYYVFLRLLVDALVSRTTVVTSTTAPTTSDIPTGETRVWANTGAGTVRLYANNGGTLVSVLMS